MHASYILHQIFAASTSKANWRAGMGARVGLNQQLGFYPKLQYVLSVFSAKGSWKAYVPSPPQPHPDAHEVICQLL